MERFKAKAKAGQAKAKAKVKRGQKGPQETPDGDDDGGGNQARRA